MSNFKALITAARLNRDESFLLVRYIYRTFELAPGGMGRNIMKCQWSFIVFEATPILFSIVGLFPSLHDEKVMMREQIVDVCSLQSRIDTKASRTGRKAFRPTSSQSCDKGREGIGANYSIY